MFFLFNIFCVSAEEYNLEYDTNGNLIQGKAAYYEYNSFNQLVRVRSDNSTGAIKAEYAYDHEGNRILKKEYNETGDVWQTTYYVDKSFIRIVNDSGSFDTAYYHHDDTLVARKDHNGKQFFYHPDHLGSTDLVTDITGAVVEQTDYLPFGDVFEGGNDRFLYTGKEKDPETGLQYYGARYYDPELRQFVQPDSIIPDIYDPQSLNRYSYVLNNPYAYTDPSGNAAIWIHWKDTFKNYLKAGLKVTKNPIRSVKTAWNMAAGAVEPDLYRSKDKGWAKATAKVLGLDLSLEHGKDAETYYHDYKGGEGRDLESDYWAAVEAGDYGAAANIEHALGHDVGSVGVSGYHATAEWQNKFQIAGVGYVHIANDVLSLFTDRGALNEKQYDRAKEFFSKTSGGSNNGDSSKTSHGVESIGNDLHAITVSYS